MHARAASGACAVEQVLGRMSTANGGASCFRPRIHLRERPLQPERAALIVVDMQNFCCHEDGPVWRELPREELSHTGASMRQAVQNIARLLAAFRSKRMEVLFTVIESLTQDGRDRSLDYKISGFNVPRGSWGARVLQEIAPLEDEILLPKTSSSLFISTNVQYVLRNLGVEQVTIVGGLTDQCVESAVRDACDMGFLVSQVTDACYTHTTDRQASSLRAVRGYCRQRTTAQLLEELLAAGPASPWLECGFRAGSTEATECVDDMEGPAPKRAKASQE